MYKLSCIMLAALLFTACSPTPPKKYLSPSRKYLLYVSINTNKDATKYKCVHLDLYDNEKGKLVDTLQTAASDNSTWAIGWHTVNDTIVLNSKDMGNMAFGIDEHQKLKQLKNYPQLNHLADSVFSKKY